MFNNVKFQHNKINEALLIPSILLAIFYLAKVFEPFALKINNDHTEFKLNNEHINLKYGKIILTIVIALILYIGFNSLLNLYEKPKITAEFFVASCAYFAVVNPLNFLVAHAIYYGPIIIFMILFYSDFKDKIARMGVSVIVIFSLFAILALNSESRRLVNIFPFFAILLISGINKYTFNKKDVLLVFIFSFVFSKIWFQLYPEGVYEDGGKLLDFPKQRFAMNTGLWTSTFMYFINLSVVIASSIIIYYFIVKAKKREISQSGS